MSPGQRQRLIDARARATVARLRFISAAQSTRGRLAFGRLKDDAITAVTDKVQDTTRTVRRRVSQRPLLSVVILTGALAILFWRPARLFALFGMRGAHLLWANRARWSRKND